MELSQENLEELCTCERPKDQIHCPYCGSYDFRARLKKITRTGPDNKIRTVTQYVCRKIGHVFDDIDREFNCKAKPLSSLKTKKQMKIEADRTQMNARLIQGDKFTENEKRHYHKITGMSSDDYAMMMRRAKAAIARKEALEQVQNNPSIPQNPVIVTVPIETETKIDFGFSNDEIYDMYAKHINSCTECMMNDDLCLVGAGFKKAWESAK